MSWPLFTTKDDVKTFDSIQTAESNDNDEYNCHQLARPGNDSLLTSLNRVCFYWRQLICNKIRFLLTLVFVTFFNLTTRLTWFTRRTIFVRSISPSSSVQTFEEDITHSSPSILNYNSPVDLPPLDNSTMAHMLVEKQQTHRTPNINLRQPPSTRNESLLRMSHSFDDRMFLFNHNSTSLLDFLHRFASEPHMSMYHSTSNGFLDQNSPPSPLITTFLPSAEDQKEANTTNCDIIEPIIEEDINSPSDTCDTISSVSNGFDKAMKLNENSSSNIERHFRRRKRRSSIQTSFSLDEAESLKTDVIEKVDNNNNRQEDKSQEVTEDLQSVAIESLSLNGKNETKEDSPVENEESNDVTAPVSRLRGRRPRYRSCRYTPSTSSELIFDNPVQFYIPTEAPPSPPLPAALSTPPSSPTASTSTSDNNSSTLPGGLKRIGSSGATKKMVRFADSVGRELAQVQYIQSLIDDDSKDIVLTKNNLYIPTTLNLTSKPWSFDVALSSTQHLDTRVPKRFFCLYRQPNSENPNIYLHEVWKSQIKLEYADIRLKSSSTSEQYLHGTAWVTNAGYWKNVTVKYTFNRWLNTYEYEAQHRCHSNDFRNIDQFEFNIDIPQDVDRIDFILRYQVNGQEHWDNNEGKNYTLETETSSAHHTSISLPHDCDFNEMRFY